MKFYLSRQYASSVSVGLNLGVCIGNSLKIQIQVIVIAIYRQNLMQSSLQTSVSLILP